MCGAGCWAGWPQLETSLAANRAQPGTDHTSAYAAATYSPRWTPCLDGGSRKRSPNASQLWVIRNGCSQLTCGMLSRMKLALLKITTAIVAAIGGSVSVEMNSPTAPRDAKQTAR